MCRPSENNSRAGDAVYEPFSGSGTTIIAAETTGRTCFAVEIDPAYVDVAVRRWQAFTGAVANRIDARGETGAGGPAIPGPSLQTAGRGEGQFLSPEARG